MGRPLRPVCSPSLTPQGGRSPSMQHLMKASISFLYASLYLQGRVKQRLVSPPLLKHC
jgi:hypothetical protein